MRLLPIAALFLLQACATGGIRPLRPNEIATAPYHGGDSKPALGSLMYEGGCLLLRMEDGSAPLLPVWPTGTSFEESLVTVHEPGKADQQVVLGEEIRLDGVPAAWPDMQREIYAPFQNQCGARPFFVTHVAPAN